MLNFVLLLVTIDYDSDCHIYYLLLEIASYYVPGSELGSENTRVNHIVTEFKESTQKSMADDTFSF